MNLVIYRKSDGKPLLHERISSFLTKETYNPSYNFEHIVKNHGGTKEDYDILWFDDVDPKIYTHEFTIQNGEVVFGEEKVIEEPTKPQPTPEERLKSLEDAVLFLSLGGM
jgi:hypothetical protein